VLHASVNIMPHLQLGGHQSRSGGQQKRSLAPTVVFAVSMAVGANIAVFSHVTPCGLVGGHPCMKVRGI